MDTEEQEKAMCIILRRVKAGEMCVDAAFAAIDALFDPITLADAHGKTIT